MTITEFKASLTNDAPPSGLHPLLEALWHDGKGNWEMAHNVAQEIHTDSGSWVHAYLHRKEGDKSNASYWYHMAGRSFPTVGLDEEWENMVGSFVGRMKVQSA